MPHEFGWTEQIRSTGGRDPLGLTHVSFRMADQLLYCITSITPRARYYSFLTWAVQKASECGEALDFDKAVRLLEKAYVLGALLGHENTSCPDGALVGSGTLGNWLQKPSAHESVNLDALPFNKNLAFGQYVSSLVDLRLIQGVESSRVSIDTEDAEEALEQSGAIQVSGLTVTDSGRLLAAHFASNSVAEELAKAVFENPASVPLNLLKEWGKKACLCGLRASVEECGLLTALFFNNPPILANAEEETSHPTRQASLRYILGRSDAFARAGATMNDRNFLHASVFEACAGPQGETVALPTPESQVDNHSRWRMAALQNNLTLGLETLFAGLLFAVERAGDQGVDLLDMMLDLDLPEVRDFWEKKAGVDLPVNLPDLSFAEFAAAFGLDLFGGLERAGLEWWEKVSLGHPLSESVLQEELDDKSMPGSPVAVSIGLVLVAGSILRYVRYHGDQSVGDWMASAVEEDAVDTCPVTILTRYKREARDVLLQPLGEWLYDLLSKDVLMPHRRVSLRKQGPFLDWPEGKRVYGRGRHYERASVGSARLPSALQILKDIGALDEQGLLTETGRRVSQWTGGENA